MVLGVFPDRELLCGQMGKHKKHGVFWNCQWFGTARGEAFVGAAKGGNRIVKDTLVDDAGSHGACQ